MLDRMFDCLSTHLVRFPPDPHQKELKVLKAIPNSVPGQQVPRIEEQEPEFGR